MNYYNDMVYTKWSIQNGLDKSENKKPRRTGAVDYNEN